MPLAYVAGAHAVRYRGAAGSGGGGGHATPLRTPARSTRVASEPSGAPRASRCWQPLQPPDDGAQFGQRALQFLQIGGDLLRIALLSEAASEEVCPARRHGELTAQLSPVPLVLAGGAVPPVWRAALQALYRRSKAAPAPPAGAFHALPSPLPVADRRLRLPAARALARRRGTGNSGTLPICTLRTRRFAVARVGRGPEG